MTDNPIRLCGGQCGLWKPVGDFGKYHHSTRCGGCRRLARQKATKEYRRKLRVEGSPEREAALAELFKPNQTLKQCRDISKVPSRKRKRFSHLPKPLRIEAERLLAISVAKKEAAGLVPIPTWTFAAMCAAASRIAQMRARGIRSIPRHTWHQVRMKKRLAIYLGIADKSWTKEEKDEWRAQKKAEAARRTAERQKSEISPADNGWSTSMGSSPSEVSKRADYDTEH